MRALARRVVAAVGAYLSCGAAYGQPHGPNCEFSCHRPGVYRVLAAAGLTVVLLTLAAPAASADEPDLWACTDEERAEMNVPDGEACWLTGAELAARGWASMDDAGDFWCAVDPGAPRWVRDVREGPC